MRHAPEKCPLLAPAPRSNAAAAQRIRRQRNPPPAAVFVQHRPEDRRAGEPEAAEAFEERREVDVTAQRLGSRSGQLKPGPREERGHRGGTRQRGHFLAPRLDAADVDEAAAMGRPDDRGTTGCSEAHRYVIALADDQSRRHATAITAPRLPDDIRPVAGEPCGNIVFLTGATGFLGSHLLRELLAAGAERVYCLVRGDRRPDQESFRDPRVVLVRGDAMRPMLGLSPDAVEAITASASAIYHCAAHVNLVYPYEELEAVNVGGTIEGLRLCARGSQDDAFHLDNCRYSRGLALRRAGGTRVRAARRSDERLCAQ
jgi:hypothetical protein